MCKAAIMIGGITTACFLALLYTFSLNDPAWNFAAQVTSYHNIGGAFGAWFSDILFTMLGMMAWPIPLAAGGTAWFLCVKKEQLTNFFIDEIISRIFGLLLFLVSGSAISSIHFHRLDQSLPAGTGGIVGGWISTPTLLFIGNFGSTVLFLILMSIGASLLLRAK